MYFWTNFFGNDGDEWELGDIKTPDGVVVKYRAFDQGERYPALPYLTARVVREGRRVDVSFVCGAVPVVNERALSFFERNCPGVMDAIPLQIGDVSEPYWVLNFYERVDCVDFWQSKARLVRASLWWREPLLLTGCERVLIGGLVNNMLVAFWPWGVHELVFHESLKNAVEKAKLTGIWFEPVNMVESGFTWHDRGWVPALRRWCMRIKAF